MDDKKILRSASIVGGLTFCSRILGMVRDVLMAGFFGTSMAMGGFVIAFMVPNLFRRLFGEGALSAAFVPVFVETRKTDGDAVAWLLARRVISMVAVTLTLVSIVGIIGAEVALRFLPPETMSHVVLSLLQIMLPYMVFICLVALCMAILNSFHHFAVPAATTMVLNLVWISTLLIFCPLIGETLLDKIRVVAWAVLVAGLLQLMVQIPIMRRHGYRFGFDLSLRDPKVKKVLLLMAPAAMGLAVSQVNVIIDKALAGWIGPWAPACLFYSERLIYFPLGVFATALSTVLLPTFSAQSADQDLPRYRETINQSLRTLQFIMIPSAVGIFVLAGPIIQMIFQWGEFTDESTRLTALSLQAYAPGLIVFSLGKVFVPAFYGLQDTRTPVLVGLGAVGLNLTMNLLAVWLWPVGSKHAGLAFATVLSSAAAGMILALLLHQRVGSPGWTQILRCLARCLVLSILMGILAMMVRNHCGRWLTGMDLSEKVTQIGSVFAAITVAGIFYFVASSLTGSVELKQILAALSGRRKRAA